MLDVNQQITNYVTIIPFNILDALKTLNVVSLMVLKAFPQNNYADLFTHDKQFEFKSKHLTDFCIFTVKSVSKYKTQHPSPVFTCFLDPSKTFYKIYYFKLF